MWIWTLPACDRYVGPENYLHLGKIRQFLYPSPSSTKGTAWESHVMPSAERISPCRVLQLRPESRGSDRLVYYGLIWQAPPLQGQAKP